MEVWLIRHGMTRLGEEGRYQGRADEGLSEGGRRALRREEAPCQAIAAGEAGGQPCAGADVGAPGGGCARALPHVYVSPALRCRETARILFPEAEQIPVPGLWEMDFGAFDGRGWWEMADDPAYRSWVDGGCLGPCPGGEDRTAFTRRVCAAFEWILEREAVPRPERAGARPPVVIVAHGGVQMAVLEKWGVPAGEYFRWQTPCGCGWRLVLDDTPGREPDKASGRRDFTLAVQEGIRFVKEGTA